MAPATTTTAASVENLILEDSLENPAQSSTTALNTSGNETNSGSIESVTIDEKGTISGNANLTSDDINGQETLQSTLMIHLNQTACSLTLINENASVLPWSGKDTSLSRGSTTIPMKLGIIRNVVLVYGEDVNLYEKAKMDDPDVWKKDFNSFDLWKQLLDKSSAPLLLYSDDHVVNASVELLFGLFLNHLKDIVNNSLDCDCNATKISHHVNKIVILVPIWFTSVHRKSIKDSAYIAGFDQSFVLNETSALATIHLAAQRLLPGTKMNILVLSENSGNMDLALYSCEANKFVHLLAVTGNRSHCKNENAGYDYASILLKQKYEKLIKETKDSETGKRIGFKQDYLRCLLAEFRQKLHLDENPIHFVECIILSHSDQNEWGVVMKEELKRNTITQYDKVGAPPIGISEQNWIPPRISVGDLVGTDKFTVFDMIPVDLHQTVNITISNEKSLEIEGEVLRNSKGLVTASVKPMETLFLYQKDISGKRWELGKIQVKPVLYFYPNYTIVQAQLSQSREGIFNLESVLASDASGSCMNKLISEKGDYAWTTPNLKTQAKEDLSLVMREMIACSKAYEEKRAKACEDLWSLSTEMAEKLWEGQHSRKLKGSTKTNLEEKVKRTSKILNTVSSSLSQLMKAGEEELLQRLNDLRFDYDEYFKNY